MKLLIEGQYKHYFEPKCGYI